MFEANSASVRATVGFTFYIFNTSKISTGKSMNSNSVELFAFHWTVAIRDLLTTGYFDDLVFYFSQFKDVTFM